MYEIQIDQITPLFILSQLNFDASDILLGVNEIVNTMMHTLLQVLYTQCQQLQFIFGDLTLKFHEMRMQQCVDIPLISSEEFSTFAMDHMFKAILCSDKADRLFDMVEAIRMMVPAAAWGAYAMFKEFVEPENEFDLNEQFDELFQFEQL